MTLAKKIRLNIFKIITLTIFKLDYMNGEKIQKGSGYLYIIGSALFCIDGMVYYFEDNDLHSILYTGGSILFLIGSVLSQISIFNIKKISQSIGVN